MQLSFKTRTAARAFHAARKAKGLPGRLVDNGSAEGSMQATQGNAKHMLSRYAVSLR